jgi:hypothetical protein
VVAEESAALPVEALEPARFQAAVLRQQSVVVPRPKVLLETT